MLASIIAVSICSVVDAFLGLLPWYLSIVAIAASNILIVYVVLSKLIELVPPQDAAKSVPET